MNIKLQAVSKHETERCVLRRASKGMTLIEILVVIAILWAVVAKPF